MTPRTRRIGEVAVAVVALLFVGRWGAAVLSEQWWAATVAPGAPSFVASWTLLGVALDVGAILAASLWFALHALIVARAIASVQITHRIGDLQLREAIPMRTLMIAAAASGILLGLIAGAGAHAWREPIALAWQGVFYGVADPLLHVDVGTLVGQLPAWELVYRFLVLLTLLGFAFCVSLYAGIGALRIAARTLYLHADARRHLGGLLAAIAAVIAIGYLLRPYELAASGWSTASAAGLALQVRAADVAAGLAAATAILSAIWAIRGRNALLVAAWTILAAGALVERGIVPSWLPITARTASRLAEARRFDALAWGIAPATNSAPSDSVPPVTSLWDPPLLRLVAARAGGTMVAASRVIVNSNGVDAPAWFVAAPAITDSDRIDVFAVSDSGLSPTGSALLLHPDADGSGPRPIWRSVEAPRSFPFGPAWQATQTGVNARGVIRRVILAWARQAPGILSDRSTSSVDWHVDPAERAAAVLPMLSWSTSDLVLMGGRITWVTIGFAVTDAFPAAAHARWAGDDVAGAVPVVIATVDAASGDTRFYLDPSAGALATAWSRIIGPLIAPATSIPSTLRATLPYSPAWLDAQAQVLATPEWNAGRMVAAGAAPVWMDGGLAAEQVVLGDLDRGGSGTIVTAFRAGGQPQLRMTHVDSVPGGERRSSSRARAQEPGSTRLRDSASAAGDSTRFGPVRWYVGQSTLASWQPVFALPPHASPLLLWVSASLGDRASVGRNAGDAWHAVLRDGQADLGRGPDEAAILTEARVWVERADSAFRRGDLTAFGRAFEALRSTLQRPSH